MSGKRKNTRKTKKEGKLVNLAKERKARKSKVGTPEWYALYPWVMKDSVRDPTAADKKSLSNCHGRVCTIKCVDTGKMRTVNTQDAFQSKRTVKAQETHLKLRRTERRQAKLKKSA